MCTNNNNDTINDCMKYNACVLHFFSKTQFSKKEIMSVRFCSFSLCSERLLLSIAVEREREGEKS